MRVGFDARSLVSPIRSGVEHYVTNLLRALARPPVIPFSGTDREKGGEVQIIAYTDRIPPETDITALQAADSPVRLRAIMARRGWLRAALPYRLWRDGANFVHLPNTIVPPILPCPAVVTVHDLAWARYPETYDPANLRMQTQVVPRSIRRAVHVIAVSHATASDLVELLGIPSAKISVTPLGVSPIFRPDGPTLPADTFPRAERVRDGCILHTGGLHPRKNVTRLLEAYAIVRREMPCPPLVIAGTTSRNSILEIRDSAIESDVIFPGQLDEPTLAAVYRSAVVVVYPSLYEGFGLPILEAMASGAPVITSNRSSMKEVAGDAAILIDPEDVEELALALKRVLSDDILRCELREKGLARSREFTWERTAKETVAVYRRLGDL